MSRMDLHPSAASHTLSQLSTRAQSVGASFHAFTPYCPGAGAEIMEVIAHCFTVSGECHKLEDKLVDGGAVARRNWETFHREIKKTLYSVDYTFHDVHTILGDGLLDAQDEGLSKNQVYWRIWQDINGAVRAESGNTLARRLRHYVGMLQELVNLIKEGEPRNDAMFDDLTIRIERLYAAQKGKHADEPPPPPPTPQQPLQPDAISPPMSPGGLSKPPSFERNRPLSPRGHHHHNHHHESISPPPRRKQPRRPSHHQFPSMEHYWGHHSSPPPPAPDPPHAAFSPAPSSTISSTISSSRSGVSSIGSGSKSSQASHWVKKVFELQPPSTPLTATGRSECFAPHRSGAVERLRHDDFEMIQELTFENGHLRVSFWQEPIHHRAKLMCRTHSVSPSSGKTNTITAYKSLTDLVVERDGSFLKFKTASDTKHWAALRFNTHESLTIFHSIFLGLRSMDSRDPLDRLRDHKLRAEEPLFEAVILDDRYKHFVKLMRDKESGCVRLQASVLDGAMARTPVWTAFVSHSVYSPQWIQRPAAAAAAAAAGGGGGDGKVVWLAELHRYVFCDDYTAQVAPGGQHELVFRSSKDAEAFEEAVDELVNPPKPPKEKDKDKGKGKEKDCCKGKDKDKKKKDDKKK